MKINQKSESISQTKKLRQYTILCDLGLVIKKNLAIPQLTKSSASDGTKSVRDLNFSQFFHSTSKSANTHPALFTTADKNKEVIIIIIGRGAVSSCLLAYIIHRV